LGASLFLTNGCATRQAAVVTRSGAPTAALILLEAGPVAVKCASTPALFSFDKSTRRTEYASDGAALATAAVLATPQLGDPGVEMGAGFIGLALVPFAATMGAVHASRSKMPLESLAACEADLEQVMTAMADQQCLRDSFLKAASAQTQRRFLPVEALGSAMPEDTVPSATLETVLEELRLQKTTASDTSYALLIKARVRLVRAQDGAVLYDEAFSYQSGTALFVDWSCPKAFQRVAQTGYRTLAAQMVEKLSVASRDEPILAGAGFKQNPSHFSQTKVLVASSTRSITGHPYARFASFSPERPDRLAVTSRGPTPYSTLSLQRPLTKDEATSEALHEVTLMVEEAGQLHNSALQLLAAGVAVPLSLWKQTVAGVRGLSDRQFKAANANLTAASLEPSLPEDLAAQVAQNLGPQDAPPVLLARHPMSGEAGRSPLLPTGNDRLLEIQIISAALQGGDGINPPLALCVEARATLLRAQDRQELYSCPVRYRSGHHRFTTWAADDARAFRSELAKCQRELGRAIVEQLADRQLIAPNRQAHFTFADNSPQP